MLLFSLANPVMFHKILDTSIFVYLVVHTVTPLIMAGPLKFFFQCLPLALPALQTIIDTAPSDSDSHIV